MTERKINTALGKINLCKKNGYGIEALLRMYLLNVDLIRFILSVSAPEQELGDKKIKLLLKLFFKELTNHPELKSIVHKRSIKSMQSWQQKMDEYFKILKLGKHVNPAALQLESEKIFGLLKISANKILLKSR